jgi:chromosome segregation ATPase
VTTKYKETSVNLHMEQETCVRMRSERDAFERDLKSLQDEIASLRNNQSSSSDKMALRVTQLEVEKKTLEKRLQQVEQDVYKANKEKKDAIAERDNATSEALRIKKNKDDIEKALNEALDAKNKLQNEIDGTYSLLFLICILEMKRILVQKERDAELFAKQSTIFKETLESINTLNAQLKKEMAIH